MSRSKTLHQNCSHNLVYVCPFKQSGPWPVRPVLPGYKPSKFGWRGPAGRRTDLCNRTHRQTHVHDEARPLVEMGSYSNGALHAQGRVRSVTASTIHLYSLCFVTGCPLMRLPNLTKSCSVRLKEVERSK